MSDIPSTDTSSGLVFSGCADHPHRTDLSCCKIRRADGSPLSIADTWSEITRLRAENATLRAELNQIIAQNQQDREES